MHRRERRRSLDPFGTPLTVRWAQRGNAEPCQAADRVAHSVRARVAAAGERHREDSNADGGPTGPRDSHPELPAIPTGPAHAAVIALVGVGGVLGTAARYALADGCRPALASRAAR